MLKIEYCSIDWNVKLQDFTLYIKFDIVNEDIIYSNLIMNIPLAHIKHPIDNLNYHKYIDTSSFFNKNKDNEENDVEYYRNHSKYKKQLEEIVKSKTNWNKLLQTEEVVSVYKEYYNRVIFNMLSSFRAMDIDYYQYIQDISNMFSSLK